MTNASSGNGDVFDLIHHGMTVLDVDGDKVGKVNLIQPGDPEAGLERRQNADREMGLLVEEFSHGYGSGGEPHVPDHIRFRMLEAGFIRIDGGFLTRTRYAIIDQIDRVEGDVVHLGTTKHELATTHMTE